MLHPARPSQARDLGKCQRSIYSSSYRAAEDVLLWRDPKISGAYFVGITLVYLLLEWSNWSVPVFMEASELPLASHCRGFNGV